MLHRGVKGVANRSLLALSILECDSSLSRLCPCGPAVALVDGIPAVPQIKLIVIHQNHHITVHHPHPCLPRVLRYAVL